ncbi:hypothetical protein [Nocardia cyriacigeorgica]|uniref:hypothetical protein n=2 Tax=Nocardia cyriacigeorgica TaxID=135487 RepID=UPI0018936772|nr:hypothetical protein [Nocardia cyriacigeorgica]MBF6454810.1 hypothetical protein [Nocardia cyriacigeorgica]MBF6552704.1 hypothetical protein [Nocardia cyriacigeorgica]
MLSRVTKCRRTCRSVASVSSCSPVFTIALMPMLVPNGEQHQQQPLPQRVAVHRLTRGHRHELRREVGQEVGFLQHVEQVDRAPAAGYLVLDCGQVLRFDQFVQLRYRDPLLATAFGDPHPAGTPLVQGPVQPFQPGRHPCAQIGDELGRIQRLTQRGVMDLAGLLEITRQVVFRVAPPVAALDVDFAPSQRVTQRDQHAQLVRYALDPVAVVDHSFTPGFRDHAVQRHQGVLVVEANLAVDRGIARQQLPSSCRGCASNGYGWSR